MEKTDDMKILSIMASNGPTLGGMEQQAIFQANEMSRLPDTQMAIVADEHFKTLAETNVAFFPCSMQRSRRHPLLFLDILRIIKTIQPDIIHAHGHKAASILSSIKPFLNKDILLIATAHNVKKSNRGLKKMHHIFAVSQGIADALKPLPSHVMLNGVKLHSPGKLSRVDLDSSLTLDPRLPIILGVGRVVPTKRFDRLVKAAHDLDANVLICGQGPELAKIKEDAPENCFFLGHRQDLRDLLYCADILVITAERDGFSLALIEALQSKLPVVSTAVPGAIDLLPDNALISNTDAFDLNAFLKGHLSNLPQLVRSQEHLFEYAQAELTIEKVSQNSRLLYQQLLSEHLKND